MDKMVKAPVNSSLVKFQESLTGRQGSVHLADHADSTSCGRYLRRMFGEWHAAVCHGAALLLRNVCVSWNDCGRAVHSNTTVRYRT